MLYQPRTCVKFKTSRIFKNISSTVPSFITMAIYVTVSQIKCQVKRRASRAGLSNVPRIVTSQPTGFTRLEPRLSAQVKDVLRDVAYFVVDFAGLNTRTWQLYVIFVSDGDVEPIVRKNTRVAVESVRDRVVEYSGLPSRDRRTARLTAKLAAFAFMFDTSPAIFSRLFSPLRVFSRLFSAIKRSEHSARMSSVMWVRRTIRSMKETTRRKIDPSNFQQR